MSWWWAIVFLMAGAFLGMMIMALCAINGEESHKDKKKWWEDE